jgi:hypothetical protein
MQKVSVKTLDRVCADEGIGCIELLKIDTEGFELQVLRGARDLLAKQKAALVYAEVEFRESERHFTPFQAFDHAMQAFGYELAGVYEQQPDWMGRKSLLFANVLYVAPWALRRGSTLSSDAHA